MSERIPGSCGSHWGGSSQARVEITWLSVSRRRKTYHGLFKSLRVRELQIPLLLIGTPAASCTVPLGRSVGAQQTRTLASKASPPDAIAEPGAKGRYDEYRCTNTKDSFREVGKLHPGRLDMIGLK